MARCPRCGAKLTVDALAGPSALPRVLATLAFLIVVIVVIFAAVR